MKYLLFVSGVLFLSLSLSAQWLTGTNGIYYNGGNVGIGTTAPTAPLYIARTAGQGDAKIILDAPDASLDSYLGLYADGSQKFALWRDRADDNLKIVNTGFSSGNTIATFTSAGNVGIGTTSPRGIFDVGANGNVYLASSPNTGTAQSVFLPGHIYIAPYSGGNISYLQARRQDNSGSTSLQIRTYNSGSLIDAMLIDSYGNVGIGTTNPGSYRLAVEGTMGARKVKVTQAPWADYVFDDQYQLPSLTEVEAFIKRHKHLPEVPTTKEVEANGLDVGDNQALLLKKIEELTLYIIELNKENRRIKKEYDERLDKLESENAILKKKITATIK